jgi:hypothetical protein
VDRTITPSPSLRLVHSDVASARRLVDRLRREATDARTRADLARDSTVRAKERAAALGARYEGRRAASSAGA